MFLLHHHGLMKDVREQTAAGSGEATDTELGSAASMGLGVADFRTVDGVYTQISALLRVIDTEADAYRDRVLSGSVAVDVSILHQFNDRKTAVKTSIKRRLQAALSPAGWAALNSYIEGSFRESIRMRRAR